MVLAISTLAHTLFEATAPKAFYNMMAFIPTLKSVKYVSHHASCISLLYVRYCAATVCMH